MKFPKNRRPLYTLFSAIFVILGSIIAIRFAQGYRLSIQKRAVQGTGLLVSNSFPNGAQVFVSGKLVTATDDNIYLEPGQYEIEIIKDGYSSWRKQLNIESELVTQTNAQLFRLVPGLTPLTFTGVTYISPSPDGEKILFQTSSASASLKNGLYVLEMSNSLLSSLREPRQIVEASPEFDMSKASFIWSPDSSEVILSTPAREVLLDLSKKNILSNLPDISFRKKEILSTWENEMYLRERQYFSKFPAEILQVATTAATNLYLSPDKKKLLYVATASATIPENISPSLSSSNSQPEERTIVAGKAYVYDREEDKNFAIDYATSSATPSSKVFLANDLDVRTPRTLTASPSSFQRLQASTSAQTAANFSRYYSPLYSFGLQWLPDSKHLLFNDLSHVYVVEYDNTNKTTLYTGPFSSNFLYPWPDGSKILILTSFSPTDMPNLYGVEIK